MASDLNAVTLKYKQLQASAKKDENIELEIRVPTNKDSFLSLYNKIIKDPEFTNPTIEYTVNIINANVYENRQHRDNQEIRYITTKEMSIPKPGEESVAVKTTYSQKQKMFSNVSRVGPKYSVNVSIEKGCKEFKASNNATMRFKSRLSLFHNNWRFDLTYVKQGNMMDLAPTIKTIKNVMFPPVTPETFGKIGETLNEKLPTMNLDGYSQYEIEAEYIPLTNSSEISSDDINAIVRKILAHIDPKHIQDTNYSELLKKVMESLYSSSMVADLIRRDRKFQNIMNKAFAMSKSVYYSDVFPGDNWFVTDKVDGNRGALIYDPAVSESHVLFNTKLVKYPCKINGKLSLSIIDCECTFSSSHTETNDTIKDVLILDVIMFDGENLAMRPFKQRKTYFEKVAEAFGITVKLFLPAAADQLEANIRQCQEVSRKAGYESDGLIFTQMDTDYLSTKNLKWKPYNKNTIDFFVVKCPTSLQGMPPYNIKANHTLYLLFVGIRYDMRMDLGINYMRDYKKIFPDSRGCGPDSYESKNKYCPIQFSPSINPYAYIWYVKDDTVSSGTLGTSGTLDQKVVEVVRNEDNTDWIFERIREDRLISDTYYGNNYPTAETVYNNYIDRFEMSDLWTKPAIYFTQTGEDWQRAKTIYHRFVYSLLIKEYLSDLQWVIDEGAGRGGDVHRYTEIGVRNLLCIDIDASAIVELIRRKYEHSERRKEAHANKNNRWTGAGEAISFYDTAQDAKYEDVIVRDTKRTTVHTMVQDLKTPYEILEKRSAYYGAYTDRIDGITSDFAFHYMCDSTDNIKNLLFFNSRMLKIGGIFIFTVLNGEAIIEVLKDTAQGDKWILNEHGIDKYVIQKKYSINVIAPANQLISIKLPFTDELREEPLCNIKYVIEEATKMGFELVKNEPMTKMLDKFASANSAYYNKISQIDKKWIALHSYVVLRLNRRLRKLGS